MRQSSAPPICEWPKIPKIELKPLGELELEEGWQWYLKHMYVGELKERIDSLTDEEVERFWAPPPGLIEYLQSTPAPTTAEELEIQERRVLDQLQNPPPRGFPSSIGRTLPAAGCFSEPMLLSELGETTSEQVVNALMVCKFPVYNTQPTVPGPPSAAGGFNHPAMPPFELFRRITAFHFSISTSCCYQRCNER